MSLDILDADDIDYDIYFQRGGDMQKAKLFTNGRSQAVRLPKEFRLPGKEVYIRREGNNVVLTPIDDPWQPFVDSLGTASEDFMPERDQGEPQQRDEIFDA